MWAAQLARLAAYKVAHGICSVPQRWPEDPRLGKWVTTQQKLKRKLDRRERSDGMAGERAAKLTALGFAWAPPRQGSKPKNEEWEAQLARLAAYKVAHGDCNVTQGWASRTRG